jgi:voltage-gated potassium channel
MAKTKNEMDESRLEVWQKWTEWPLTVLSIVFFGVYAWQILAEPKGSGDFYANLIMNVFWAVFGINYIVSITLANNKKYWFTHHIFDLLVVVLPMLRPMRAIRVLTALNALHRTSGIALRGKITMYVGVTMVMMLLIDSLSILDAERHAAGATITSFGRALWWSFVTITTVGYGDYSPITLMGRFIAFILMIGGIALIGVVTATLASWIVDEVNTQEEEHNEVTKEQMDVLIRKIDSLESVVKSTAYRNSANDES